MFRTAPMLAMLVAPIIGGCGSSSQNAFENLTGHDSNVVVLAKQPILIAGARTTLTSSEVMKVNGESTSVCFSLRGGLPLQNSDVMDREFARAMHGARVRVVIELTTGERVALDQPLMAWNMFGKIVKSDELSACASIPCSTKLPVGARVSRIEVSSEPSLAVQGIYWSSERGPLENAAPPATSGAPAAPESQAACHVSVRTDWGLYSVGAIAGLTPYSRRSPRTAPGQRPPPLDY
jgi:hypothetical protein